MRGKDEDSGEFLGPSRSAQRREALDVLELAKQLVELDAGKLAKLPLGEHLLPHIAQARRISSHIARKREVAFLAKQLRREDEDALDALHDALDVGGEAARLDTARLHRAEEWRERLLGEDGDAALAALIDGFPGADSQRLRQLARNALAERKANKPPRAFRELYREIRALLDAEGTGESGRPAGEDSEDHLQEQL
ncbi:ribosome biogenesis factor YjgA [Luteimonas sp. MJ246]|uniref:ribosome biogenesis factor YjgA n=1 Tax=Luteimonas sp. MJ174 TaxID=3129237 RepID=UPI0031BA9776